MPVVNGRLIRPSTLAERRLFLGQFGTSFLRVPRTQNPYAVARKIRRLVMSSELSFLYDLARRSKKYTAPPVSPDVDVPDSVPEAEDVAAAE